MYKELSQCLESTLGSDFSKILAKPVEKPGTNFLEWHSPVEGKPIIFEELSQEEKYSLRARLAFTAKHLLHVGSIYSSSENQSLESLGLIIMEISMTVADFVAGAPSPLKVFTVGDTPVISGWGLSNHRKKSITSYQKDASSQILSTGLVPFGLHKLPGKDYTMN
jgi:hypothetical protein